MSAKAHTRRVHLYVDGCVCVFPAADLVCLSKSTVAAYEGDLVTGLFIPTTQIQKNCSCVRIVHVMRVLVQC